MKKFGEWMLPFVASALINASFGGFRRLEGFPNADPIVVRGFRIGRGEKIAPFVARFATPLLERLHVPLVPQVHMWTGRTRAEFRRKMRQCSGWRPCDWRGPRDKEELMTDDSLTGEEVRGFAAAFSADRTARIVQNAVAETPIDKVAMDREIVTSIDPSVSVKVDTWPITNQKKSGRCWLFSGLNSLKSAVYEHTGVEEFEFSQNYQHFWDKLEKANYFLTSMIELADRPVSGSLNFKIHWIEMLSYANEMPPCMYAGAEIRNGAFHGWKTADAAERARSSMMAVKQDVKLLNEHIITYTVEKPLAHIIAKRRLKAEYIDWFLPHYSSGFFRDKVAAGLANAGLPIPQEKWFTNLTEKGNTGSASIYIILEEFMRTFALQNGQKILCYIPESGRFSTCFMLLEAV